MHEEESQIEKWAKIQKYKKRKNERKKNTNSRIICEFVFYLRKTIDKKNRCRSLRKFLISLFGSSLFTLGDVSGFISSLGDNCWNWLSLFSSTSLSWKDDVCNTRFLRSCLCFLLIDEMIFIKVILIVIFPYWFNLAKCGWDCWY